MLLPTSDPTEGTIPSKLSVSGNLIVDEEGEELRLRGVHFMDPFVLEKDDFDLSGDGLADNHFAEVEPDWKTLDEFGEFVKEHLQQE